MASDKEIRRLLALYFDGATTDAQEQELREFFARDTVPADLAYAKAMSVSYTHLTLPTKRRV